MVCGPLAGLGHFTKLCPLCLLSMLVLTVPAAVPFPCCAEIRDFQTFPKSRGSRFPISNPELQKRCSAIFFIRPDLRRPRHFSSRMPPIECQSPADDPSAFREARTARRSVRQARAAALLSWRGISALPLQRLWATRYLSLPSFPSGCSRSSCTASFFFPFNNVIINTPPPGAKMVHSSHVHLQDRTADPPRLLRLLSLRSMARTPSCRPLASVCC